MLSSPPAWLAAAISFARGGVEIVARGDEYPLDLLVGDHRGEPVGAEQEEVAVLRREREEVDLDLGVGAERASDDRALRVGLGLLGREAAAANELRDQGVILGQLGELVLAQQVGARVADVPDHDAVVLDQRHRHRRAHAASGRRSRSSRRRRAGSPPGSARSPARRRAGRRGPARAPTRPRAARRPLPPALRPCRRRSRTAAARETSASSFRRLRRPVSVRALEPITLIARSGSPSRRRARCPQEPGAETTSSVRR